MSIIEQIRARSKSGPGSVEVMMPGDDKPVIVKLRYPTAADKAKFVEHSETLDTEATGVDAMTQNDAMNRLMLMLCWDEKGKDELSDDDIDILIKESGGYTGGLMQRCTQLLGFGANTDNSKIVKAGKRRGR